LGGINFAAFRPMTSERIELLEGVHRIPELAASWDALADQVAAPPWLRPTWTELWWRAFGRGRLQLFTAWRGDRLVGVVPMQRLAGELRSTSNYHTPSFEFLAVDDSSKEALACALIRAAPRRLTLAFLCLGEGSLEAVEAMSRAEDRPYLVRPLERCLFVETHGSWDDLLASRRNGFIREMHRRRRKLGRQGRVEFDVQDGRTDLERLLDEGFAVEAAGWKGVGGTAIGSRPATRSFYTDLARWLASRGALSLSFLRLDGRPIAFDFAIEEAGRHCLLKTGYDEAFQSVSPGHELHRLTIERAFTRGLRRFDFLGKDDQWKREWTSSADVQVQLQTFRRSPPALADFAAQRYLRPIARRLLRR
jgi:CelD/BcsL family acetyltransferase involved in cellulose biosynthesis